MRLSRPNHLVVPRFWLTFGRFTPALPYSVFSPGQEALLQNYYFSSCSFLLPSYPASSPLLLCCSFALPREPNADDTFQHHHSIITAAMFLSRGSRTLRTQWSASKAMGRATMGRTSQAGVPRWFSESRRLCAVKPVLLADIGEGTWLSNHKICKTNYTY